MGSLQTALGISYPTPPQPPWCCTALSPPAAGAFLPGHATFPWQVCCLSLPHHPCSLPYSITLTISSNKSKLVNFSISLLLSAPFRVSKVWWHVKMLFTHQSLTDKNPWNNSAVLVYRLFPTQPRSECQKHSFAGLDNFRLSGHSALRNPGLKFLLVLLQTEFSFLSIPCQACRVLSHEGLTPLTAAFQAWSPPRANLLGPDKDLLKQSSSSLPWILAGQRRQQHYPQPDQAGYWFENPPTQMGHYSPAASCRAGMGCKTEEC